MVLDLAVLLGMNLSRFDRNSLTFARIEAVLIRMKKRMRKHLAERETG